MSAEFEDPIVYRRHSNGRIHKDVTKRVSFDENALNDKKIKELKALHGNNDLKSDEFELELLKKSVDACHEAEKCDFDKKTGQDIVQFSGRPCTPIKRLPRKEFPSLLERGTPEGQEDPNQYSSASSLFDCGKDWITKDASKVSGTMFLIYGMKNYTEK